MTATLLPKTFRSGRKGKARCVGAELTRLPTGAQPQAAVGSALWAGPEPGKGGFQDLGLKTCYSYYLQLRMGCVPGEPHGRGVLSFKY